MAQVNRWKGHREIEELDRECRFCKEEKEFSIFWTFGADNSFYICKDCYEALRGLFIDILLENEEENQISIVGQLDSLGKKIEGIKEMRKKNR